MLEGLRGLGAQGGSVEVYDNVQKAVIKTIPKKKKCKKAKWLSEEALQIAALSLHWMRITSRQVTCP